MRFERHPDANLLSAHWEGKLRADEQEAVLQHLSECADCRQVAAQARELGSACGSEALRRAQAVPRDWNAPRWGTAAACAVLALVAAGWWLRPNPRLVTSAPPLNALALQPWNPPAVPRPVRARASRPIVAQPPRNLAVTANRLPDLPSLPLPASSTEIQPAIDFSPLMTGFMDQSPSPAAAYQASAELASWAGAAPALVTPVVAATPAEPTAAAAAAAAWPFANGFAGHAEATPSGPLAPSLPIAGLGWAISHSGQLLRSIGSGVWAAVPLVPGVHIRALFSAESLIWAGGRADQLYSSSDDGSHWRQVRLPGLGTHPPQLSSISFADPQHGLVTASDGASWSTADGGQSWIKR